MTGYPSRFPEGDRPGELFPSHLETTDLFLNGITPERIERVAKIFPQLLQRSRPALAASTVAHHWRADGSASQHEGWRVGGAIFEQPVRNEEGTISEQTRGYALFIPPEGGLQVCSTTGDPNGSWDIYLTSDRMAYYDERIGGRSPFSREIPDDARLFNSIAVGALVTDLAMTHGVLERARDFVVTDPPQQA